MVKFVTDNAPPSAPRKRMMTDAQIEALRALEAARDAATARRLDTRRKVVLGAALMSAAVHNPDAARLLALLKGSLTRPADRKLFEGLPNG